FVANLACAIVTGTREDVMDTQRNVETLRDAYAAWSESRGGSAQRWMDIVHDDVQFGSLARAVAPEVAFLTENTNHEALGAYFAGVAQDWEMIHYTVSEFVAQGDVVVVRSTMAWRNRRTGREVDTPKVDFWRFRGDKAAEVYEYYDTARVIA